MKDLRIIVAGSREYDDYHEAEEFLDETIKHLVKCKEYSAENIEIVSGGCRGADKLGERFAKEHGYKVTQFPADWQAEGLAAGPLRNQRMALYASQDNVIGVLVAFWDGKSRGTANMIDCAKKRKLAVIIKEIS